MSNEKIQYIFDKYEKGILTRNEVLGHLVLRMKPEDIDVVYQTLQEKKRWLEEFNLYMKNADKMMIFIGGSLRKIEQDRKDVAKMWIKKFL